MIVITSRTATYRPTEIDKRTPNADSTRSPLFFILLAVTRAVRRLVLLGVLRLDALGEDVLGLLERHPDVPDLLAVAVEQVDGLLAVPVLDARVATRLAHHLDHLQAELRVLLVGEAHGEVQRGFLVNAGERVALEVLDVEEGVHGVVCRRKHSQSQGRAQKDWQNNSQLPYMAQM